LAIECDGVIFRDFSGFEEYYSDEYRDIDPLGKESLENAELRKIDLDFTFIGSFSESHEKHL
jgi:hypothetical protein